ncbi:hypothetical protein Syn7502_02721 [Synechococcus sp. PCC 7502]|uniref:hypothetical protein n=1 Tax=Synechococcus sp. PCC 7502 TaxID=1173263 RepID=UPI00029FEB0E|nr:hypothetical protein [Synechococcus sp. PCC 7502]AFY74672.1 hypothetical protein Syn7502_02721 [Synechococcus sp. PCC 7502]
MKTSQFTGLVVTLIGFGLAWNVRSQPNNMTLSRNFRPDPIVIEGSAGGNVSLVKLAGVDAKCRGFASSQPNHVIELSSNFPMLDILAYTNNINDDLTMLIKDNNGLVICADDEYQKRYPQFTRRLRQGTYQIWVGNNEQDKLIRYKLSVSESPQK